MANGTYAYPRRPYRTRARLERNPATRLWRTGLRREWYGSRSGGRAGEAGEDAEVGVKRDLLKPTDSDRAESPLMLEPAELPFHGCAATVEIAPPLRLARDERVEPVSPN